MGFAAHSSSHSSQACSFISGVSHAASTISLTSVRGEREWLVWFQNPVFKRCRDDLTHVRMPRFISSSARLAQFTRRRGSPQRRFCGFHDHKLMVRVDPPRKPCGEPQKAAPLQRRRHTGHHPPSLSEFSRAHLSSSVPLGGPEVMPLRAPRGARSARDAYTISGQPLTPSHAKSSHNPANCVCSTGSASPIGPAAWRGCATVWLLRSRAVSFSAPSGRRSSDDASEAAREPFCPAFAHYGATV